jgi:hypothetical protein
MRRTALAVVDVLPMVEQKERASLKWGLMSSW